MALERERAMSKEIFELLQLAREHNDYVTEHLCLHHMVPEQHAEEQALEEVCVVRDKGDWKLLCMGPY